MLPAKRMTEDTETCMTMRHNWGYDRTDDALEKPKDIIEFLALCGARGVNLLLNVGPTPEGTLLPEEIERLKEVGEWMKVNGESIYGTNYSPVDFDFWWGAMTQKDQTVYLHVLEWKPEGIEFNGIVGKPAKAYFLADPERKALPVTYDANGHVTKIEVPAKAPDPQKYRDCCGVRCTRRRRSGCEGQVSLVYQSQDETYRYSAKGRCRQTGVTRSRYRRLIMKTLLKSLLLTLCCFAGAAAHAAPDKPNIVYILADDLGYGDVQCLNPERGKIATPHMDKLAAQGMVFTDAHTSSSVCTPTRYGVLTGRYNWRTQLQKGVLHGFDEPLIAPNRLTVPALLKQHGYTTACIGKWHLGLGIPKGEPSPKIPAGPITCGFDRFFGIAASLDMPPFAFIDNDHFTEPLTTTKEISTQRAGRRRVLKRWMCCRR